MPTALLFRIHVLLSTQTEEQKEWDRAGNVDWREALVNKHYILVSIISDLVLQYIIKLLCQHLSRHCPDDD